MKIKELILLLFIFHCFSCDNSKSFMINGNKEYNLSSKCGTIKIKGSSLPTHPILIGCTFNGKYHINTDSLKLETIPSEVIVTNIRFKLNNEIFNEKELETNINDSFSIWFNVESEIPFYRSMVTILIPPSNFITCQNKSIMTDTIRIQLKN